MAEFIPFPALLSTGRSPEHVLAIDSDGEPILWAHFSEDVGKATTDLRRMDTDLYVLGCENVYHFLVGFMALLTAEKHIIIAPNLQPKILSSIAEQSGGVIINDEMLGDLLAKQSQNIAFDIMDSASSYITMYTSGSSSSPVAVTRPLQAFISEVNILHRLWGTNIYESRLASSVAHYHAYGLLFQLLWPLCEGLPILLERITYPEALEEYVARGPVSFISSPAFLTRTESDVLKGLDFIASAGAPLPLKTAQKFTPPIVEIYGSTETGIIATRNICDGERWSCLPDVIVQASDAEQLLVRSPYTGQSEWTAISDYVELCEDGRFLLKGRSDRVVKIHEKRVSLTQMEGVCVEDPFVYDARVITFGDTAHLACVVVLSKDGQDMLERIGNGSMVKRLKAHLRPSFDLVLLPRKWRFVHAFPRNDMGKILRIDLLALFEKKETL